MGRAMSFEDVLCMRGQLGGLQKSCIQAEAWTAISPEPSGALQSPMQLSRVQWSSQEPSGSLQSPMQLSRAQCSSPEPSAALENPVELSRAQWSSPEPSRAFQSPVNLFRPQRISQEPSPTFRQLFAGLDTQEVGSSALTQHSEHPWVWRVWGRCWLGGFLQPLL